MQKKLLVAGALATGAAAGVIGGMLFAPHRGTVTRSKLRAAGKSARERAEERAKKLKDTANQGKERAMQTARKAT